MICDSLIMKFQLVRNVWCSTILALGRNELLYLGDFYVFEFDGNMLLRNIY